MRLTRLETAIREAHEEDTAVERRLNLAARQALALRDKIVADGRINQDDVPAIIDLLRLLPAMAGQIEESLRENLRINMMYCELASQSVARA